MEEALAKIKKNGWQNYFCVQRLQVYLHHIKTGAVRVEQAERVVPKEFAPAAIVCQVELPLMLNDKTLNPDDWEINAAIIFDQD